MTDLAIIRKALESSRNYELHSWPHDTKVADEALTVLSRLEAQQAEGWQPIERANVAPYEKVDVWAVDRKTGLGYRHANAYRANKYWLDHRGHYIGGKHYRDDEGDDCLDPDAVDEESTVVTHWRLPPPPPAKGEGE